MLSDLIRNRMRRYFTGQNEIILQHNIPSYNSLAKNSIITGMKWIAYENSKQAWLSKK